MASTTKKSTSSTDTASGSGGVARNGDLLMMSISTFYAQKGVMAKILAIINGSSKQCSLRLVDWFVTNYARVHNTIITNRINHNIVHFNVYLSYRSQLKAYSKQQFDPFRRRERILFYYERDKSVETTIGQLNFFRWVLQNNLLDYIISHQTEIEQDMITQQKLHKATAAGPVATPPVAATATATAATATAATATETQQTSTQQTSSLQKSKNINMTKTTQAKKTSDKTPRKQHVAARKKSKHQSAALRNVNMNQLGGVRMILFD